jgi:hypothetical protein
LQQFAKDVVSATDSPLLELWYLAHRLEVLKVVFQSKILRQGVPVVLVVLLVHIRIALASIVQRIIYEKWFYFEGIIRNPKVKGSGDGAMDERPLLRPVRLFSFLVRRWVHMSLICEKSLSDAME